MMSLGPQSAMHRYRISQALREYHAKRGHLKNFQKSGPAHPNWRGGIKPDYYRHIAFDAYGQRCDVCTRTPPTYLIVHHKDRDRRNNDVENLQVLCMSCHLRLHRRERTFA